MYLFEYFTQSESLEYMRHINDRKIYVGLKNEIIHFIDSEDMHMSSVYRSQTNQDSESKAKDKGDIKLAMEMLYSPKGKSKVRMFSKGSEIEIGGEEPAFYGNNWRTIVRSFPFFDERERMNPQIEQMARQIIEKREIDQKGKEEQTEYKEQIAKIQSNVEILLQRIDKLDSVDDVNSKILQKLMEFEKKIKSTAD